MDAQVANALVMGDGYPQQRQQAVTAYERRRSEANQALLKAFELSGDNPAERETVLSVLNGLGRYERLAGQALLLDERSKHAPGPPPEEVVATYRQATDLMRLVLLPQAYNLTLENGTIVRRTYDEKAGLLPLLRGAVVVAGLLALACLVWLQVYLAGRFRRVFGPALLVATVATAVAMFFGATVLGQDAAALREAKSSGFDSVLTLAKTRAISNSMQGDQSRYLLDKERADTYEHTFLDKSLSVVYVEAGNLDKYHSQVAADGNKFLGLLGPELVDPRRALEQLVLERFEPLQLVLDLVLAERDLGAALVELCGALLQVRLERVSKPLTKPHAVSIEPPEARETPLSGGGLWPDSAFPLA